MAEIPPEAVKALAAQILKIAHVSQGALCPRCHGNPASHRWPSGRVRIYRCGCGHKWEPPRTRASQVSVQEIVYRLSCGEPVPPIPDKVPCPACESGDGHV